jgi:hypothetical protein
MGIRIGIGGLRVGSSCVPYWKQRFPSDLVARTNSDTKINLFWSNNGLLDYTGNKIYISTDNSTFTLKDTIATIGVTYTISGLTANTLYYIKIAAYKIGVNSISAYSNISTVTTDLQWFRAGGIAAVNAKGAYSPFKAASLAASYVNEASPGTFDITTVAAPDWDAVAGWKFNGLSQYLKTGIIPVNDQSWSMIVKYTEYTTGSDTIAGLYESATKTFYLQLNGTSNKKIAGNGGTTVGISTTSALGTFTVAGNKKYFNGVNLGDPIGAGSGSITYDIWIGQLHYSTDSGWFDGNVQAIAIYNKVLSYLENYELTLAMVTKSAQNQIRQNYVNNAFGALICWTIDSFSNIVPNTPNSNVNVFNPSDLDIDQWLDVCVAAGMKYVYLTVKAEDGFCMWPTAYAVPTYSPYSIGSTTWYAAQGNRDITLEFVTKARAKGLFTGLYFGVMDLTWEARTGKDETTDAAGYITMVKAQLTELLSNYGRIDAIWIDSWSMRIGYEEIPFLTLYDHIVGLQANCVVIDNSHEHPSLHSKIEIYEQPIPDGSIPAGNTRLSEEVVSIRNDGFWYYDSTKDQTAATLFTKAQINALKAQVNSRAGALLLGITPDTTGHLPAAQKVLLESLTI